MADGVAITPGAGATVATDDCGAAGHAQVVKLAVSANGDATPIPADATDGLLVNLGANNDITVNGVATEAKQDTLIAAVATQTTLAALLTELQDKLEAGEAVELGAATLAALETVTATLSGAVALDSATLAALETIQAAQSGTWNIADVSGAVSLPTGAATEAALQAILTELGQKLEAGQSVELGATTLAALETITAIISGSVAVTGTFWQATQPVSLASVPSHAVTNAGTFAVQATPRLSSTATLANVAASASSVTIRALNASRLGLVVVNDSAATLYLKYGSTASATSFTYLVLPGATWEMPANVLYTGIVTGIWTSATGNARVTELS